MASITSRKRSNGSTAHMAQIVIKRNGKTVHRENKTFSRKQAAFAWAHEREEELKVPGALDHLPNAQATLATAIDRYVSTSVKEIGRTKAQVLRAIKAYPIADLLCSDIQSHDVIELATELGKKRTPQTVANYLSHLGAVFAIARPAWGYPLNEQVVRDAFRVAKRLGVTGKSVHRDRRPTLHELDLLMQHFLHRKQRAPQAMPMHMVIAFSLFSTRRQEETTRLLWSDLDEKHSRVLVRDMKNPGEKHGNHVWCDLPAQALSIIRSMPRGKDQIFPYSTDAISANFTRACKLLGIEDLHFHDLRHEGVSRLFEIGYSIPRAASVSGHRSWASLKRYTHIREDGDKYDGWKWLSVITELNVRTDAEHHRVSEIEPHADKVTLAAIDPLLADDELFPDLLFDEPTPITRKELRALFKSAHKPVRIDPLADQLQYENAPKSVGCDYDPLADAPPGSYQAYDPLLD